MSLAKVSAVLPPQHAGPAHRPPQLAFGDGWSFESLGLRPSSAGALSSITAWLPGGLTVTQTEATDVSANIVGSSALGNSSAAAAAQQSTLAVQAEDEPVRQPEPAGASSGEQMPLSKTKQNAASAPRAFVRLGNARSAFSSYESPSTPSASPLASSERAASTLTTSTTAAAATAAASDRTSSGDGSASSGSQQRDAGEPASSGFVPAAGRPHHAYGAHHHPAAIDRCPSSASILVGLPPLPFPPGIPPNLPVNPEILEQMMLASAYSAASAASDHHRLQQLQAHQQSRATAASLHRAEAVARYLKKRKERTFEKKVRYQSRQRLAESRPRIRGQFVKAADLAAFRAEEAARNGAASSEGSGGGSAPAEEGGDM